MPAAEKAFTAWQWNHQQKITGIMSVQTSAPSSGKIKKTAQSNNVVTAVTP